MWCSPRWRSRLTAAGVGDPLRSFTLHLGVFRRIGQRPSVDPEIRSWHDGRRASASCGVDVVLDHVQKFVDLICRVLGRLDMGWLFTCHSGSPLVDCREYQYLTWGAPRPSGMRRINSETGPTRLSARKLLTGRILSVWRPAASSGILTSSIDRTASVRGRTHIPRLLRPATTL